MDKRKDYTKIKFPNGIIAIKYLYPGKDNHPIWKLRCHCEKEFIADASSVLREKTNSCGCSRRHKDYTKVKFPNGNTAIRFLYVDENFRCIWEFKYKCGNLFKSAPSRVKCGTLRSCGCAPNTSSGGYSKKYNFSYDSRWELNFVKVLEYLRIKWQREPKKFKLSNGTVYIPDFYILKYNMFVEIKGRWFKGSKEKTKLFKKEYPEYNYYVIDKKKYIEIAKQFKFLLTI